jgi:hypothetical protein
LAAAVRVAAPILQETYRELQALPAVFVLLLAQINILQTRQKILMNKFLQQLALAHGQFQRV